MTNCLHGNTGSDVKGCVFEIEAKSGRSKMMEEVEPSEGASEVSGVGEEETRPPGVR